jgi:hypothetical protein
MAAIATVLGLNRAGVGALPKPRFDVWSNERMDSYAASCRSKARAKLATLAMAGSVAHYVELGWSEAKRGGVTRVQTDGSMDITHDGPTPIIIQSLIPRPPPRLPGE